MSNDKPILPNEIRTAYFPFACALSSLGEVLVSAKSMGRSCEWTFARTERAAALEAALANPDRFDAHIPLRSYCVAMDEFRDVLHGRSEWLAGKAICDETKLFVTDKSTGKSRAI